MNTVVTNDERRCYKLRANRLRQLDFGNCMLRFGEVVSGAKLVRLPDALGKTDGMGDCFIP